jgi:hypothetical protein
MVVVRGREGMMVERVDSEAPQGPAQAMRQVSHVTCRTSRGKERLSHVLIPNK